METIEIQVEADVAKTYQAARPAAKSPGLGEFMAEAGNAGDAIASNDGCHG
jgi:hypothetical protein